MTDAATVKTRIRTAFASVEPPPDWCLSSSREGDEPRLLARDFSGKHDWRTLDPAFLDQAPDGFGTALSFFSDEALRFYLPAYLIADLDGCLERQDPVFTLAYHLTDSARTKRMNPRRYGDRTWFEATAYRFSIFDLQQAAAIIAYLQFKRENSVNQQELIDQALTNYWLARERKTGQDLTS